MYKINRSAFSCLILFVCLLSSCFNEKKITYFQKGPNQGDTIAISRAYIPKIQAGDILSIYVNSLSPEASTFFNPYVTSASNDSGSGSSGGLSEAAAPGFLVDESGSIAIPLIGTITLKNLSTVEAQNLIKQKLNTYLKEATVIVRLLNYKISIVGEVTKPGVYVIPNERTTIPEALAIAGDLTVFAKRDQIQIIRDNNGKKEFAEVDLTNRDVFASPYYYLHANDIIYVKPGKSKVAQTDLALKILPLAISVVSLLIVIIK